MDDATYNHHVEKQIDVMRVTIHLTAIAQVSHVTCNIILIVDIYNTLYIHLFGCACLNVYTLNGLRLESPSLYSTLCHTKSSLKVEVPYYLYEHGCLKK